MLYRLGQPMRRKGTQNQQFVKRIPSDLGDRMVGITLRFPLGNGIHSVDITRSMQSIRFSLKTSEPGEVKIREATALAYFETVCKGLKANTPITLEHRQTVALSKILFDSWSADPNILGSMAIEYDENTKTWSRVPTDIKDIGRAAKLTAKRLRIALEEDDSETAEKMVGLLVDRVLLERGIGTVTSESRNMLLVEFVRALADGMETLTRKTLKGDYTDDPKTNRFPEAADIVPNSTPKGAVSLQRLVSKWWLEAEASGISVSTHETYERAFEKLASFRGHDDADRVTLKDISAFKDWRLQQVSRATGTNICPNCKIQRCFGV